MRNESKILISKVIITREVQAEETGNRRGRKRDLQEVLFIRTDDCFYKTGQGGKAVVGWVGRGDVYRTKTLT